jgi:hypothetical protein
VIKVSNIPGIYLLNQPEMYALLMTAFGSPDNKPLGENEQHQIRELEQTFVNIGILCPVCSCNHYQTMNQSIRNLITIWLWIATLVLLPTSIGKQGVTVAKEGDARVYVKDLEDGSKAVGLFNTGTNGSITVRVKWSDLKVSGQQTVRDLWRQKDLGQFNDKFEIRIPPYGAEMVKILAKAQ